MKVLIMIPRTNDGGIASYFNAIRNLLSADVSFFNRGKAIWPEGTGLINELIRMIKDYYNFWKEVRKKKYNIIHVNTFFGSMSILRDSVFIIIASLYRTKIILFFRGWDKKYIKRSRKFFFTKFILFRVSAIITLSKAEKKQLIRWGFKKNIFLESTTVDKNLVKGIDKSFLQNKFGKNNKINLLFLSRVEVSKGIYELVDAFNDLRKNKNNINLTIAGNGRELNNVKNYIHKKQIIGVNFAGFVSGDKKRKTFISSHIFILPSYSEGMPNSVLEAFAFGLPVITTPVGGLRDIFNDKVNGFLVKPKDVNDLKEKIQTLIKDKQMMKRISITNYDYAKEKFVSTKVAKRIDDIYQKVVLVE